MESQPPRLMEVVRRAIRVRHYSTRTEEAYVGWIRRYIAHHRMRHPREMGPAEVAAFLSWLADHRRVAASTQNQALQAVLFLYREVLGTDLGLVEGVVRARRSITLPVVLARTEVRATLGGLQATMPRPAHQGL